MPPAGRPRTFDRDEALKKAMYVFWEKGYEGTSMADLIDSIGMKAPSIYAAFGNKDELFREVVELYKKQVEQGPLKALYLSSHILDALENSLNEYVKMLKGSNVSGCLIMGGAINCAPDHQEHVEHLRDMRGKYKQALKKRFTQAVKDGQLNKTADPDELAEFYFGFIHGLALRANDGSSQKELQSSSKLALTVLKSELRES